MLLDGYTVRRQECPRNIEILNFIVLHRHSCLLARLGRGALYVV